MISRKRKLAAAEKYFRGSPYFLRNIWEFIGQRSRSGGGQGGHKPAHRRLPPGGGVGACGLHGANLAWPKSPLDFFHSGKNHFGVFLPFGQGGGGGGGLWAPWSPPGLAQKPPGLLSFGKNHFRIFLRFGLPSKIRSEKSQKHEKTGTGTWH